MVDMAVVVMADMEASFHLHHHPHRTAYPIVRPAHTAHHPAHTDPHLAHTVHHPVHMAHLPTLTMAVPPSDTPASLALISVMSNRVFK